MSGSEAQKKDGTGERIRALGPTNLFHGKQTEGGAVVEALLHAHGAARSNGRVDLIRRK